MSTALALHVEALSLLNPDRKLKWYDKQFQVMRRHRDDVRSRSRDNVEQILSVCTHLHSFSLSNLSTALSRFFVVSPAPGAWLGLDSSKLNEMRMLSFHGDGTASFLFKYTPGICWTFSALTELHLTKLYFSGFGNAAFPVLRRLSITDCYFSDDYNEVLPSHSALHSDVAFVENLMVSNMDEPADIFARWPHDALRSVKLGTNEWVGFCNTDWSLPGLSRVESIQIVVPVHIPYLRRCGTLPPSVQSLIVPTSNGVCEHDICWDLNRKDALRYLEGMVAEGLSWKRIHVTGLYADDCAWMRWLCQEAGVQLSFGYAGKWHLLLLQPG